MKSIQTRAAVWKIGGLFGILLLTGMLSLTMPRTVTAQTATDATPSPTPLPQTICQAAADDQALLVIGPLNEPAPADASLGVSASALQARQIQDALVASRAAK